MKTNLHNGNPEDRLVILPTLRAVENQNGTVVITRKFLQGMLEFGKFWNGPIAAYMEPTSRQTDNLDNLDVHPADLPFELAVLSYDSPELIQRLAGRSMVMAGVSYRQNHISRVCRTIGVPCVYGAEYTLKTRLQIIRAERPDAVRLLRRYVWQYNQERRQRKAIASADGIQCNGTPTYDAYKDINCNPFLFFDTRTTEAMAMPAEELERRLHELTTDRPLRLAFSGRLIHMKGADHLPRIAAALRRRSVPFEMYICGGGALEERMRTEIDRIGLQDCVFLKGTLDFKTELVPFMQQNIDLFICPHRQGDPSCTYLETLACGVPILGYDNEAFAGIRQRAAVGWLVPMDNVEAAADSAARLHRNRAQLAEFSRNALTFAREHTFEKAYAARVAHLRQCAKEGAIGSTG